MLICYMPFYSWLKDEVCTAISDDVLPVFSYAANFQEAASKCYVHHKRKQVMERVSLPEQRTL